MDSRTGVDLRFEAFFTAGKVGKTGLSVIVDVYENDVKIVTDGAATEGGGGFYRYLLTAVNVDLHGNYKSVFKTADGTVDQQHLPGLLTTPDWADMIAAIKVKTDTIITGALTVLSALSGGLLTLIKGDSYDGLAHPNITFNDDGTWPSLVGATVRFGLAVNDASEVNELLVTCTVSGAGTGSQAVTVPMTSVQTDALTSRSPTFHPLVNTHNYSLKATLSGGDSRTLTYGQANVLPDYTE